MEYFWVYEEKLVKSNDYVGKCEKGWNFFGEIK